MDKLPVIQNVAGAWRRLAKDQKISAGLLGVCGLIAFALSVQRLQASIRDPFTVSKDKFLQARTTIEGLNPEQRELDASKRRDTDGDGISDYDEKLIGTSPYLRDTDGDGVPDNVELAQGGNPNCFAGQPCASQEIDLSLVATSSPFLIQRSVPGGEALYAEFQRGVNDQKRVVREQTGSTSTVLEEGLVRDPAVIRKVLLDSGKVDPEILNKITDAQLLQVYDQAVLEQSRKQLEESTGSKEIPPLPSSLEE
ncbi:hypothetical protein HY479_02900 [Candidatus Uhrbacteria bacterium]|nr:hypothetical protein [Candidatus Uhrbacteria bacterium]